MSASTSTAPPPPQPQILLFARAVLALLDLWPALTIAVKEAWGGPESAEKKTWIASTLIDEFESRAVYSPAASASAPLLDPKSDHPLDFDEIADLLSQMMSDEFDANLEDGSIDLISAEIGKVWDAIVLKTEEEAEAAVGLLEKRAGERKGKVTGTKGAGLIGENGEELGHDDNSGSESGSGDDGDDDEGGMEVEEAPQLVQREKVEKVVDEDGFELVQKGKRK
jgi:pre-rRNA-processing protein TSR2